jgi:ferric-dicitrate binding protein FerR (iron transport regulator)
VKHHQSVDRERVQMLMMAALDGELAPSDRSELETALASHPDIADQWRRLARVKEVTNGMSLRKPAEEIWDGYWRSTYRRGERGVAWLLISAGATVLAAYWVWHAVQAFLQDTSAPLAIRAAIASLVLGAVILALSVLREKLFTHRADPYQKEIIR